MQPTAAPMHDVDLTLALYCMHLLVSKLVLDALDVLTVATDSELADCANQTCWHGVARHVGSPWRL